MGKNGFLKNDYVLSFLRKTISLISTVAFTSLLSRFLGPELKGRYTYFFSIVHILVIITQFGFFNLYPSFKRKNENVGDSFFTIVLFKFFFLVMLSFGLAFLTKLLFSSWLFFWLPFVVCLNSLQAELLFFLLVDKIRRYNYLQIVIPSANALLMVLIFFFLETNLPVTIALFCVKDILTIVFCLILNPQKIVLSKETVEIIKSSAKSVIFPVLCALLLDLNYKVDVLFIRELLTEYSVGIYSAAVAISEIAWQIPDVFKEVLFNRVARDDSHNEINACLRFSNTIMFFVLVALVFLGRFVIQILYGDDYSESYSVMIILLIGVFSMSIFKILNPLIQATNKWWFYTLTLLIAVASNVVLNFVLIPRYELIGASVASIVSYSICGFTLLVYYMIRYGVSITKVLVIRFSDLKEIGKWFSKK